MDNVSDHIGNIHHFNILVWNVQGAGSHEFLHILKEHLLIHKPYILALVETRISGTRAQAICDRIGFNKSCRMEAQGFQGGIWVLWNDEELGIETITMHEQYVTMEIHYQQLRSWLLTIVYANPHTPRRETLWNELETFASNCNKQWLLAGDFNETINLDERNHGGNEMLRRCTRFRHWIENCGLIDLGFSGLKFTWARGLHPENRKEARLDRALCNAEWRLRFPEATVQHLLRVGSNHSPLLVSTGPIQQRKNHNRPFRFQAAWVTHYQFEEFVKNNWNPQDPLLRNLQCLASKLTSWNREVFGNLYSRKRRLWNRIIGIQRSLVAGSPSHILKLERKLRRELAQTLDQIETLWFQKSRMERLKDGDRNTKYFHTSTIIRRRNNRVDALRDQSGNWCTNQAQIKDTVLTHFQQLFTSDGTEHSDDL